MIEQLKNILADIKAIQAKLPELRDLFWLKIDRYNETAKNALIEREAKIERETQITKHIPKQAPLSMRVIFPDGTIIEEHKASLTFIKTIEKIGVEKIEQLKIKHTVRADEQFDRNKVQVVKVGSMYVNIYSSTTEKKRILDTVSNRRNLNLQVEVTKTNNLCSK
ncbi:MAG: hypothetical protein LBT56_08655 [Prevotellaceae bacterium]|jgi:hypothetical protein|nr:hypothetical protein [Prevotellaceae bacterium]